MQEIIFIVIAILIVIGIIKHMFKLIKLAFIIGIIVVIAKIVLPYLVE